MNLARAAGAALLVLAPALAEAASPFDGFWMKVNADKSLDPGSQVEFRVEKNILSMATPQGQGYRAKLDGTDSPVANDTATTSVSVKLEGRNVMVETAKLNGKAWLVTTMEVEADGKTAKVSWKNLRNNSSGSYVMSKQ
ncbi:hypothetical protein [Ramlibacter sp. PS4R-6]|uniref:hypothetical protein n=1 Tax=Ramlibacter sp. PS4R-6 TaxID=3133438 RepID=UPI0030A1A317